MDDEPSDAEVLRRSLAEPACFATLYERHVGPVHAFLQRRVGSEAAEDLAAEAFVRAFRGRAKYGVQHDTALPWLLGIATNLVGDHRRAERRRLAAMERLVVADDDRGGHETGPAMLSPGLVKALRRLPNRDRDALLLVTWGELSYEETARALDVPVGTVRSRIARARKQLAENIDVRQGAQPREGVVQGEGNA
jgi:RNA polymerase sigma factor (sigma-70 family)